MNTLSSLSPLRVSSLLLIAAACTSSRSPEPPVAAEPPLSTPTSPPEVEGPATKDGSGERIAPFGEPIRLAGVCEASGAGWVSHGSVPELWVVDDEQPGVVRRFGADGAPVGPLTLRNIDGSPFEIDDMEGLAPAAPGAWLMGSHSLSKNGKMKSRGRLAHLGPLGEVLMVSTALRPGAELAPELVAAAAAACPECALPVEATTGVAKKGGLDLEGVALDGEGSLLVGLRGPRVGPGRALVVRVADPGGAFQIGPAYALDLGGRGVRDLAWDAPRGRALVLAGASGEDGPPPAIYGWRPGEEAKLLLDLEDRPGEAPEALALGPDPDGLWVLWDSGSRIEKTSPNYNCESLLAAGFTEWSEARRYTLGPAEAAIPTGSASKDGAPESP